MCEWGTNVLLEVTIPAGLSHTGEARQKLVDVDACIAPLVQALNDVGMTTASSCCGHGKRPSNIVLADGREIVICPDYETSRKVDAYLDTIGYGPINPCPAGRAEGGEVES